LDRRLGGPQSRSECGAEEKNSQAIPGLEPPFSNALLLLSSSSYLIAGLLSPGISLLEPVMYRITEASSFRL
jgi:hypothetical protein